MHFPADPMSHRPDFVRHGFDGWGRGDV